MKVRFFDIMMILMVLVVAGVKTDIVTGSEPPVRVWTLEEASYLGNNELTHSSGRGIVQAVTRQNEGVESIFKCRIHQNN
jgi:hypothetical protein